MIGSAQLIGAQLGNYEIQAECSLTRTPMKYIISATMNSLFDNLSMLRRRTRRPTRMGPEGGRCVRGE